MRPQFVKKILRDEVTIFDAEITSWGAMQFYFDSMPDGHEHDSQAIIAQIEVRLEQLRFRQEQLLKLIGQLEESRVTGMV